MINQLYLLRHGIAVPPGTPGIDDDQRPLTPKGERRMKQEARGLARLGLTLDRIVSSPLPRALTTAQIVAKALEIPDLLTTDDALRAGQSAASIRQWLQGREETSLMLVGHDPAFSELVGLLTTGEVEPMICELSKGGIAAFVNHADNRLQLEWLAPPRLLRKLRK